MNRVKELRLRAGMRQKEVAIACGVARATVSQWESNLKDPTGERIRKLSELFGVTIGVILCYEDVPPAPTTIPVVLLENTINPSINDAINADPERGKLVSLAIQADIKNVRRTLAILNALTTVED